MLNITQEDSLFPKIQIKTESERVALTGMCFTFVVSLIPGGECKTRQLRHQFSWLDDGNV